MEISLTSEVETRLNQLASRMGRGADQVVQELVVSYLEHQEWFKGEVEKGFASLERGEFIAHDAVGHRVKRILQA